MNSSVVACPHCGQSLEIDDSIVGKTVECPFCGKSLSVAAPAAPPQNDDLVTFSCPHCGQQMGTDKSFNGQYVECPTCGKRFRGEAEPPRPKHRPKPVASPSKPVPGGLLWTALVFKILSLFSVLFYALYYGQTALYLAWGRHPPDFIESFKLLFFVSFVPHLICWLILHHRCWKCLPYKFARMTPRKAVGLFFVPYFNLYWPFPSLSGLGKDVRVYVKHSGFRPKGALASLGLSLAILTCVNLSLWYGYPFIILFFAGDIDAVPAYGFYGILHGVIYLAEIVIWILFYRGIARQLNAIGR